LCYTKHETVVLPQTLFSSRIKKSTIENPWEIPERKRSHGKSGFQVDITTTEQLYCVIHPVKS